MKVHELIESSNTNRSDIIRILRILEKHKVDFTVIGGAAEVLQIGGTAKDIDVLVSSDGDLYEIDGKFFDYTNGPRADGKARKLEIDGHLVHIVKMGDVDYEAQKLLSNSDFDSIDGFNVLSLVGIIENSTNKKRHEKLVRIIKAKKLPEEWFKNLDSKYWRDYASAWDEVNKIPVDDVVRWKKLFDKAVVV